MWPQRPVPVDREHGVQWHGDEAHGEVRHGQGEQEVVADRLQLFVDLEADHHHGIADDGKHRQDAGDDGDDDLLRETVGAGGEVDAGRQLSEVGGVIERDEHAVNWASLGPRGPPRPAAGAASSADRARARLRTQTHGVRVSSHRITTRCDIR